MPTFLNLKEAVAQNLGKTDATVYNIKREGSINRARRTFYQSAEWSFTKKSQTVPVTGQVANLPADFSYQLGVDAVYTYSGNLKCAYMRVDWEDLGMYNGTGFVYAMDPTNKQFKVSQDIAEVTIDYHYLPSDITATDGSHDTDVEAAPDTTAIELLATAYYYLASRGQKGSYNLFHDMYKEEQARIMELDQQNEAPLFFHSNVRRNATTGYQTPR